MAQVTGTVIVKMNSKSLRSKEGAEMDLGGFSREAVYGDNELIGFARKPKAASVKATLAHTSATDLQALADAENVTIIFQTDTGKTYTIRNAFAVEPPTLKGGSGDVEIEFMGKPAVE